MSDVKHTPDQMAVLKSAYDALCKAGGGALALAMSTDHPNPDGVLMDMFHDCNEAARDLAEVLRALSNSERTDG